MAWTTKVDPTDESFHPRSANPWWGESSFITFRVPEGTLMRMLSHYFRPQQSSFLGGPLTCDDAGPDVSSCLFTGWDWHQSIPAGADMFDHRVESSFAIETIEPQKRYRYTYDNRIECAYDLVYEAAREPYYQRQVE